MYYSVNIESGTKEWRVLVNNKCIDSCSRINNVAFEVICFDDFINIIVDGGRDIILNDNIVFSSVMLYSILFFGFWESDNKFTFSFFYK